MVDGNSVGVQREMFGPAVNSWIEEADQRLRSRNKRPRITPFVQVAKETGIREIICLGRPSVLLADNVVDLTSEERILFMNKAVFTQASCSCNDDSP